ncbi:hypothetical protein ACGF0J_13615 [Nonomuraea sp. NPDC047897]|uniref:hypothetical protein n=1 Tax=Nonomuraea sp. NPDC047897 TaxID=3364346 RepID=UPI0037235278
MTIKHSSYINRYLFWDVAKSSWFNHLSDQDLEYDITVLGPETPSLTTLGTHLRRATLRGAERNQTVRARSHVMHSNAYGAISVSYMKAAELRLLLEGFASSTCIPIFDGKYTNRPVSVIRKELAPYLLNRTFRIQNHRIFFRRI